MGMRPRGDGIAEERDTDPRRHNDLKRERDCCHERDSISLQGHGEKADADGTVHDDRPEQRAWRRPAGGPQTPHSLGRRRQPNQLSTSMLGIS
jgi:hypothetical protein